MAAVRQALQSFAADVARARAASLAPRWHVAALSLALLLAALTALGLPVPLLAGAHGRLVPVALFTLGLWALGPLLRALARWTLRPASEALARRLDDERGWKDAASTALGVESGPGGAGGAGAVGAHLVVVATALVRAAAAPLHGAPERGRPWLRRGLLALFALALLLPGVRGLGGERGAGRHGGIGSGWREEGGAQNADEWLARHGHLSLRSAPAAAAGEVAPLLVSFRTARPLPVDFVGEVTLLWDDVARGAVGDVRAGAGARARVDLALALAEVRELAPHLTPGRHRARVRLTPRQAPFTLPLLSEEVVVDVPPGSSGGAGGAGEPPPTPPPTPPPRTPAPPPPAPPVPEEPAPAPTPPPVPPPAPPPGVGREEAVTPLINPGDVVRKEQAVVAVRDPDAGLEPTWKPLAEALRELRRAPESEWIGEHVGPRERAFLVRYFQTLEALVTPQPAADGERRR